MAKQIVALVFGGRSVEHQVSIVSARAVAQGLEEAGYQVVPVGIAPNGCWLDPQTSRAALIGELDALPSPDEPTPRTLRHLLESGAEVVFPLVHGTWGEDGTLQGLCEMLDLPYAGAGVAASALAMDKLLCKRVLEAAGVPVVEFLGVSRRQLEQGKEAVLGLAAELPLPLFVKPSVGGSSVGVRKVTRRESLEEAIVAALAFDDQVLVERGVEGRELECSVLGLHELEASVVGEIVPGREFYDYEDKYLLDTAQLLAPAQLTDELAQRVREMAVAAFAAVGGWGMARVDFLVDGERVYVNEINTVPGFTRISMYPRLWALSGLPLPRLVERLVEIALERHRQRRELDAGIKDWLAALAARK